MKKMLLAFALGLSSYATYAQEKSVELGLRTGMNLAYNNAESDNDEFQSNGSGVRLSGGLVADFYLNKTAAFSTGLWYTIKRSAFQAKNSNGNTEGSSVYNLQTLQVPITLKLFTSDIAEDMRLYFQLGGTLDIELAEKPQDKDKNYLYIETDKSSNVYSPLGVSLLLGAGVEWRLSDSNTFFAGLSFNRGLNNPLGSAELRGTGGTKVKDAIDSINSLIGIEVGLKF